MVYPQKNELNTVPDSVLLHLNSLDMAGSKSGIDVRVEYSIHVPSSNVINQRRFSCLKVKILPIKSVYSSHKSTETIFIVAEVKSVSPSQIKL